MGGSLGQGRRVQEREKGWGCMTNKEQWEGVMDRTEGEKIKWKGKGYGKDGKGEYRGAVTMR